MGERGVYAAMVCKSPSGARRIWLVIPTNPSERIEDFLTFLTACGEKGEEAVAQGCGASREELVALMSLCRYPLPAFYVGYQRQFGHSDEILDLFDDAYVDIAELLDDYRRFEKENYEWLPDNAVLIGHDTVTGHVLLVYPDDDSPGGAGRRKGGSGRHTCGREDVGEVLHPLRL